MVVLVLDEDGVGAEDDKMVIYCKIKVRPMTEEYTTLASCDVETAVIPPVTIYTSHPLDCWMAWERQATVSISYPPILINTDPLNRNTVHKVTYHGIRIRRRGLRDKPYCFDIPELTLSFRHPSAQPSQSQAKSRIVFHQVSHSSYKESGLMKNRIKVSEVAVHTKHVRIELDLGQLSEYFRSEDISHCRSDISDTIPVSGLYHLPLQLSCDPVSY